MLINKFFFNAKRKLSNIFIIFKKQGEKSSNRLKNLTSIPGIGEKNCNHFYEAGYMTPESIISAPDEELLKIPGVGINFIKQLRSKLGRI